MPVQQRRFPVQKQSSRRRTKTVPRRFTHAVAKHGFRIMSWGCGDRRILSKSSLQAHPWHLSRSNVAICQCGSPQSEADSLFCDFSAPGERGQDESKNSSLPSGATASEAEQQDQDGGSWEWCVAQLGCWLQACGFGLGGWDSEFRLECCKLVVSTLFLRRSGFST